MCTCVHIRVRAHLCARVCMCVHACLCVRVCMHVCAGTCAPAQGAWGVVLVENRESEQVAQSRSSDALATDLGDRTHRPGNRVDLVWIPAPLYERASVPHLGESSPSQDG